MLRRGGWVGATLGALACLLVFASGSGATAASGGGPLERVLIRASKPYDRVEATVQAAGGEIRHRYKYIDAVAANVPRDRLSAVRALVGARAVTKDALIAAPDVPARSLPSGRGPLGAEVADSATTASAIDSVQELASAHPDAYLINNSILNVNPLHAGNTLGQGVIVAVIDSGIRPGRPHISLDGSVIGGEDFVGDGLGFSNNLNGGHGTFVAGMISANVVFQFASTSLFLRSVRLHCPSCVTGPLQNQVPMIGTAPLSSIYALRVFGPTGGAPTSRILQAMERTIELREQFDAGAGGRNIQVANMSLGGPSLFAGRDLFDREVDAMLDHDIVVTTSAGNAGPSSLTTGSPGSAIGALTVGASSTPVHERVLRDLQFGFGIGSLYRPFSGIQTAYFSSRGPNADGRSDPDVTANGFASYGQGFANSPSSIDLASGTSFSAPTVAGVAALLEQKFPAATSRQIRNAIIMTANPNVLSDGSTALDQGEGMVDAAGAANALAAGTVPDSVEKPRKPKKDVDRNIERGTALQPLSGNVAARVTDLKPGQRADFLYEVGPDTAQVTITIGNLATGAVQNALFGDDILLAVHSAKTSAIGEGDYQFFGFITGGTFVLPASEPGLMRVTVNGDWTNASPISADVAISSTQAAEKAKGATSRGKIREGETLAIPLTVPANIANLEFSLSWTGDWSHYPTSDIDLILQNPAGELNFDGATLDSPERVVLTSPEGGNWIVYIDGFELPAGKDDYVLRVIADGKLIK